MKLGRQTIREIASDPRQYKAISKDYGVEERTVSRIKRKHHHAEATEGIPADPRVIGRKPAYSLELAKKVYLDKRPPNEIMKDYDLSIWQILNIKYKKVAKCYYDLAALDE